MKQIYKIAFTLFLFVVLNLPVSTQNLVPNPSFELFSNCPSTTDISYAIDWQNPTGYSPDYYNSCANSTGPGDGFSVPNNWWGTQFAKSGNAYAGIITGCFNGDCREYIQTELIDTLESGKNYIVSFWVCLGDSTAYAVNDIGIYFSNTPINSTDNLVLNYTPQIENNIQNSLCIANTWINIKDTLTALGDEIFLTIGNFKNDVNSDSCINNNGAWWNFPYYYIDDVSVTLQDTLTAIENQNDFEFIKIYPNPIYDYFIIEHKLNSTPYQLSIYNCIGQIIYQENEITNKINRINAQNFDKGFYIIKIESEYEKSSIKLIKN